VKDIPLRVKGIPLRVKKVKETPLRVKEAKNIPLRVKEVSLRATKSFIRTNNRKARCIDIGSRLPRGLWCLRRYLNL
jgi:hypothetical protein